MELLMNYWYVIVGVIAVLIMIGIAIYKFAGLPTKSQVAKIKEWLLYAVTKAETELGEKTGQLGPMMDKVAKYYQELHKNAVGQIKAFIEPVMIIILATIVGVVLLSVVFPMFDMYQNIGA